MVYDMRLVKTVLVKNRGRFFYFLNKKDIR